MGIWEYEPNTDSFEHLGLTCEIWRDSGGGFLCARVELPAGHPWWSAAERGEYIDTGVHGGPGPRWRQGDGSGWASFDCAHAGDLKPFWDYPKWTEGRTYRDLSYVRGECRKLAQAIRLAENTAKYEPIDDVRARALKYLGPEAVRILEEAARKG